MIYNCHSHSEHSHDSDARIEDMCRAAVESGLAGLAVTDHCDCEYAQRDRVWDRIEASMIDTAIQVERFHDRLKVMKGVEIGDPLFDPEFAKRITDAFPYDVVLLSVHAVRFQKNNAPFSTIDFSGWTDTDIDGYLRAYFSDLSDSIDRFDFDVLSHLTVPIRYICKKYGRTVNLRRYYGQIDAILEKVIAADKTLELNTQSAEGVNGYFLPDEKILDRYLRKGGKQISLGSDAHRPEQIAAGLQKAADLLLAKGVRNLYYFENRRKTEYPIL